MMFKRISGSEVLTLFAVILIAVTAGSCKKKESDKPQPAPPVKVSVMVVSNDGYKMSEEYTGVVGSSDATTVSFSVAGTIQSLAYKEGDKVAKGAVMGRIDNSDYINANNIAQSDLAEARDAYERLKKMHDANALPDVKWVEMQEKLKQAENAAELSKRALNDAVLTAPVSGTVSRKFANVGENVIAVQPVYEIMNMGELTFNISVGENDIKNFRPGMHASVTLDSDDSLNLDGIVTSTALTADPMTRTYTVKIRINDKGGKILPGMMGKARFDISGATESSEEGIFLPQNIVQLDHDNRQFVWVTDKGTAERRFVKADELCAKGVRIESGLVPGDTVITAGMQKISTGSKIIPIIE